MSVTPRIGYAPRAGGGHIGYTLVGDGPPMLSWAGGTVTAAALFEEPRCARSQRRLATFSTQIVLDRRGMGYSDPLPPGELPTLESQAQDALAVLDHLQLERAVVFANGWDGQAMVHLAVEHPDRVDKLVLQAFTPCPLSRPDWPHGVPLQVLDAVQAELTTPGQGRGPQNILQLLAPSSVGDADLLHWFEEAGRVSPATAQAYVAATMQMDVRPLLPQVRVPTLVLHSARDPWTPVEGARFCADAVPGARLVEIDSADHIPFTDKLDDRLDAIESFVVPDHAVHGQRRLMAVLFTDVVGSTERLSNTPDHRWSVVLDEVDSTVARHVGRHEGRVCKSMGDGHLALFDRPSDAIAAALDLVRALAVLGTPIRAGIHIGEVEIRGDDVAGVAVHVGARVSGRAGSGEVLVTRTVADLVAGSGFRTSEAGEHDLKGLPGPWTLFRVDPSR